MKNLHWIIMLVAILLGTNNKVLAKHYETAELPIVVRVVPEWCGEYPTVINNWKGLFIKSVKGNLPPLLSVIVSINGKDTKGMNETTFNELLLSKDNCTLEYLTKTKGTNEKSQCTIRYHKSIYWAEGIEMSNPNPLPENVTLKNIKNASAFSFNSFAFQVGNMEQINEQAILEAAGKVLTNMGFSKQADNTDADMILSLSKERDDYNGHALTLSILDGSKMKEGTKRILWEMTISDLTANFSTQESAIKRTVNNLCGNFPFDQSVYSKSMEMLGIGFESKDAVSSGRILEVLKGTDAYEKGLRGGDDIVGAYAGYTFSTYYTKTRRYYFKPNRKDKQKNWGVDLLIILPIVPQYTYNNAEHYLVDNTFRGGIDSRNHFRVKNKDGRKTSMYAPFEKKTFNLKYIR